MPIFRIDDKLHYFAHVPKCGGSSLEAYLTERFGRLAFHEPTRSLIPKDQRWNRSSGEHIPVAVLDMLVPPEWFASSFAVVRHPTRRLISAFFFARDVLGTLPLSTEFNTWFREIPALIADKPYKYGSHLAPQSSFVPNGSRIFRMEAGLEQVLPYLDTLAGNTDGPREIPAKNVGKWRRDEEPPTLSDETLDLIARFYAVDFERFGYDAPLTDRAAKSLPDLPARAATGQPPLPARRRVLQRLYRSLRKRAERR
jgi:Sulfotransferase family